MTLKLRLPDIKEIEAKEKETNHFAKGLNFYKLFWIFFIGCFLGVVVETLWCIATRGHYESRVGLIYGPFNLVYGFGALAIALGLYFLRAKRDFYILLGGVFIGGIVEYLCSVMQELMFGSISWDYSTFPFNLAGRINLLYSIFWGILAIVWIKFLYPIFTSLILKIPNKFGKILTWVLFSFMIFNTLMSAFAVRRWASRLNGQAFPADRCSVYSYFDRHYPDSKMSKIYANMVFLIKDANINQN